MMSEMNVRLVYTNNEHIEQYVGEIRKCRFHDGKRLLLTREDGHYILTSEVKKFIQNGQKITVRTKNSIYELEIIA